MRALVAFASCIAVAMASNVPCQLLVQDKNTTWQLLERPCQFVAGQSAPTNDSKAIDWPSPFTVQVRSANMALKLSPIHTAKRAQDNWWLPIGYRCRHNYSAVFYCNSSYDYQMTLMA